ncbi:glycosyltransferase family 4 protein [Polynucleobacter alcilacus]|uniref:glycosyltransferase family 4 protein n=1 Tax=Polynucleobacter alcilacus TaxID=1819739 RepID=UPI001C0E08CE|nr:glycosyltransferase family 1 protein [Polynucleobacter alcilacus]MBU3567376.1 glycosyltransferase family 1 protein [Polynucleobacter alcilacus]
MTLNNLGNTSEINLNASVKVAIVTETYPPEVNGVASTIARFIQGLAELGHDITLIRPRQGLKDKPKNESHFKEILTVGIPIPGYSALRMGIPQKNRLIKQWSTDRPSLVHIVTEGPLGWSALEAAKKLNIPVCSDFRTNFDAYSTHYGLSCLKSPIQRYLRYFHNNSHFTMVPTQALKNQLLSHGFERLRVLARGIDTELFNPSKRSHELRNQWGVKDHQKVVLYVGRLASEKNLQVTVDTFRAMLQVNPNLKMVWVGDGPQKGALKLSCPNSIFTGVQTGEALATHYASGDLFLFSSLSETFGNVTLEAMASGLAVLAYDYAAARQFIDHGVNGFLADPNEANSFVNQGLELMKENCDIQNLRTHARQTTLEISWDKVTKKLENNYHDLILNSHLKDKLASSPALRKIFIKQ